MKELERLKKDWKTNNNFPELSKEEIYTFLYKKSSSIVKWIFIISLLEFGFWSLIGLITKNSEAQQRFDSYNVDAIMMPLMVIGYIILIYFFVMFYKNYKEISNTDSTKSLMQKILKTRKTVKHYVIFNLVFLFISSIIGAVIEFSNNSDLKLTISQFENTNDLYIFYAIIGGITLIAIVVLLAILIGFYYLVYGILLKRLKENYKELEVIELE
ncbi:hypothetical protein N9Y27_00640 [Flavobacteriaceae bacterium]|nr:hypothetical protein [Flavobacteriaceae bacterium]